MAKDKLFKKVPRSSAFGTSYVGYIEAAYDHLVEVVGEPHQGVSGDRKTDAEWGFKLRSGVIFTIYNYKNGPAYCRKGKVEDIREWNIGAMFHTDHKEIFAALTSLGLDAKSRRF